MDFEIEKIDGITVVTLPGETLEAGTTHEFKQHIAPVLKSHAKVVFDVSRLRFVDSSGCGALLHCLRTMEKNGGTLKICCASKQLDTLFRLIHLDSKLEIYDSREAAVASFDR